MRIVEMCSQWVEKNNMLNRHLESFEAKVKNVENFVIQESELALPLKKASNIFVGTKR